MTLRDRLESTSARTLLNLLIGRQWGQRVVVIGAIVTYLWLWLTDPATATESAASGLETFVNMFTLILASLLIASALETVLPRNALAGWIGDAAGARGVVLAGLIGGMLPGGPYATYPIIRGVADRGGSYPAMLTMLIGYGLIGLGRVPFGLAFFGVWIVAARVTIAVGVTILVGILLYAMDQTAPGGRILSFDAG